MLPARDRRGGARSFTLGLVIEDVANPFCSDGGAFGPRDAAKRRPIPGVWRCG